MYENMPILMKIQDELPKRIDLSDNRNFKDEKEYIPDLWKKHRFTDTDAFIKAMMEEKDKFYSDMKPIFSRLKVISYVLVLILVSIAIIIMAQGLVL